MGRTFTKILVANRGEIAVRIMRTCRAMSIGTVAVYSEADLHSPHVRTADEAVWIGRAPSSESYLQMESVLEAAKKTGVDAIHPGYGFLAENAEFAAACEQSGFVFIGPQSTVIREMGLKTTARKMMAACGIPVVPGYDDEDQGPEFLRNKILEIGLPILIKASAGGGGKGMRIVRDEKAIDQAIEGARREAESSFGNGSLLIEKYIENARHIEYQILGDSFGNLVHLFERDCSIQRRYQKIIEESPSPILNHELRGLMGEAAVNAGRAIGYINAGTVEFILAPSGEFFFIEVNTRLQVEHAVTEMTTGLDLVRLQIEIAEGHPLPFNQDDIKLVGCAIEARVYAEQPENGFQPAAGRIQDWTFPPADGLRIDAGVENGSEVGIYYDSMLAKVIAHGPSRAAAIRKLAYALKMSSVQGLNTNIDFLIRILELPTFCQGNFHTGLITEHFNQLIAEENPSYDLISATVVALFLQMSRQAERLPGISPAFHNNPFRPPHVKLKVKGRVYDLAYQLVGDRAYVVTHGDVQLDVQIISLHSSSIRLSIDRVQREFRVIRSGDDFFVHSSLGSRLVIRVPRYPSPQPQTGMETTTAPMPGQVARILVTEGQCVSRGDSLLILVAMKMELTINASMDGFVEAIKVKVGDVIAEGDILVHVGNHHRLALKEK